VYLSIVSICKELILLFNKDELNQSKVTVKIFIMVTNPFEINHTSYFKSFKITLKKCITVSPKVLSSATLLFVFNIDNNKKCFLSTKSAF